jgi:S1-C subfamily serine protease
VTASLCVCGSLLLPEHRSCPACGRRRETLLELATPADGGWAAAAARTTRERRASARTRPGRSPWVTAAAILLALLAVLGVAFTVGYRSASLAPQVVARFIPGPFATPTSALTPQPLSVVADRALSRVVTVQVVTSGGEEFGTGWLLDGHGDVVTNDHVIQGGTGIRLLDSRRVMHVGMVMGHDPAQDVAVIRSVDGLPGVGAPLPLATEGDAPHPEGVVVLASAKATNHGDRTVETLALLHQSIPVQGDGQAGPPGTGGETYEDMMVLHGSPIFRGNSGGPVLDAYGRVVGIVTLASQSTPQAFAIPIVRVVAELRSFASRTVPVQR